MPPLPAGHFQCDIQKRVGGEYWTNRYVLAGEGITPLVAVANQIVAAEKAVHYAAVEFVSLRVSDTNPATDAYVTQPIGGTGAISMTGITLMPLFVVVRVEFGAELGRPSRKYLRGCLSEGDVTFNDISSARALFIFDNYGQTLRDLPQFVDVDGQQLITATVVPQVGMRQLRRGSKRKTQPVIAVG